MRRWSLMLAASSALAAFNVFWRFPANTGNAHWAEWVAFFASPPLFWPLIWLAAAGAIRRARKLDPQAHPLSMVKPLIFSLLMTAPGWLPAANTRPRLFVQALTTLV